MFLLKTNDNPFNFILLMKKAIFREVIVACFL